MNTPTKEKEITKNSIDRAVFVKAMAEVMMNLSPDQIKVPTKYREQVLVVKDLLKNDTSGIVNSLLDFAITSAMVNYSIETDSEELTKLFQDWLWGINGELRGQIPTGVLALAKEYFRERWKGSSFLILRSIWEERDGFTIPTKLWFVNGEDVIIGDDTETFTIGNEKYSLKINSKQAKRIPFSKDEKIFVQKPYESWGTSYPTPFIIRRGLYKNLRLLEILVTKGEYVVGKALEYLLLLKKGTENLALANQAEFIYSKEDLTGIKTHLEELLSNRKTVSGTPTYATNFDTSIEHLIPEYDKALKQELFSPIERRLLAGLGLIDVLQGVSSTRRESTLNPRPFIAEVESGISDFKMILNDILLTIIELNRVKHPKYVGKIKDIHSTPISQFITDDVRSQLRIMYDRGVISKRTYAEVVGEVDFDIEIARRKVEKDAGLEEDMFPPVINNIDEQLGANSQKQDKEVIPNAPGNKQTDKTNTDAKASLEIVGGVASIEVQEVPDDIKEILPKLGQKIWLRVFNETSSKGEEYAKKVSWAVIKKYFKKSGDKWVAKKKTSESAFDNAIPELVRSAELDIELKEAQLKLLKKITAEEK